MSGELHGCRYVCNRVHVKMANAEDGNFSHLRTLYPRAPGSLAQGCCSGAPQEPDQMEMDVSTPACHGQAWAGRRPGCEVEVMAGGEVRQPHRFVTSSA
jgi:hypothetical protein